VDLFAGAGGATQGLCDAGFDVVAAAENDPLAAESFAANHPGVVLAGDVRSVEPGRLRRYLGLAVGELDLLKACPPCQGFSSLARGEVDADRNDLVLDVYRFVSAFMPRAVLLENVPGLARDDRLGVLLAAMTRLGYRHAQYPVDAQQFGVPQRRRRLIVIALRGDVPAAPPDDLLAALPDHFDTTPTTAGQALAALEEHDLSGDPQHRHRRSGPAVAARIAAVPVGGTRFDLPPEHRLDCHDRLTRHGRPVTRQATSSYGRVRADAPAPTMTTRCTTPACGAFVHPTENRGLTLREAASLQTFPPGYAFSGGYDAVERQIGNAVPVRMAHALGLAVQALLTDQEAAAPQESPCDGRAGLLAACAAAATAGRAALQGLFAR
jgi:DNA (cytosine-5)-methyltransferase 1